MRSNNQKIKVPAKVLDVWKKKQSRGDIQKLVKLLSLSKPTIIQAVKHGQASSDLILKISRYYSKKEQPTVRELETKALEIMNQNDVYERQSS